MAASPKEIVLDFSIDISGLADPEYCQDADTIAKALEKVIDLGLGGDSVSDVTAIGCTTLSSNADSGNTECGGCLAGAAFSPPNTLPKDLSGAESATSTVQVQVTSKSSTCTDAACFQTLYNTIISELTTYVTSGDLTAQMVAWAAARVPPVPELENASVDDSSFTTDGSFTNPLDDPNGMISAVSVTTTGELSVPDLGTTVEGYEVTSTGSFAVDNLDTSSMTTTEKQSAMSYFEESIIQELESQGALLTGTTLSVTSISNGVVQYTFTTYAESSASASTSADQVETALSQTPTLSDISAEVISKASGTSIATDLAIVSITSNTDTGSTQSTTSVVTASGELDVSSFDPSSFTTSQEAEAIGYFEDAITVELESQGLLPDGAFITITGIENGKVQYEVSLYGDSTSDSSTFVTLIEAQLEESSTLTAISTTVKTESANSSTGIATNLASVSVDSNTAQGTTGIDLTYTEKLEAMAYFEDAIASSLEAEGVLPAGAIVSVTDIVDGAVQYEIILNEDSETSADSALSSLTSAMSSTSTLQAISAAVAISSAGSSSSALMISMQSIAIPSSAQGETTKSTVAKATSTGEITTNVDTSSMSTAELDEVKAFFADSITSSLDSEGALPPGSVVSVTGIVGGVIQYEITMYLDPAADAGSIVSTIDSTFAKSSTIAAISSAVIADSSGSSVATALASLNVTGVTPGETTGVSHNPWFPNWSDPEAKTCANTAFPPTFMSSSPQEYLFDSLQECCDVWFAYEPRCASASSNALKFFPDYDSNVCGRKKEKQFESYESDRYDTLEECCSNRFPLNRDECCSVSGLGGCPVVGTAAYLPNWSKSTCFAKSESALTYSEAIYAKTSAEKCCSDTFGWNKVKCCEDAGGC